MFQIKRRKNKTVINKFFKSMGIAALCIAMLLVCSSCQQESDYYDDEQFQEGIEYGQEDMFLRLYNAVGFYNDETLKHGKVWNTKHFKLTFKDGNVDNNKYLFYDLYLKKTTVEKCYEDQELFFYIYAISDTEGLLLEGDDYFYDGLWGRDGEVDDYLNGRTINGEVKLLDNSSAQTMLIIIMIDGTVYTARYEI